MNNFTSNFKVLTIIINIFHSIRIQIFRRKKLFCTSFCVILFFALLKIISRALAISCSFAEIEEAIEHICGSYNSGDAIGNACAEICNSEFLQTSSCLLHHLGKDVVFLAVYRGEKVVVKSSKLSADNFDQIFWITFNGSIGYPDLETFYSMIRDNVQRNLNIKLDVWNGKEKHLISKLWSSNLQPLSELAPSTLNIAMNNIWHLMQQNEYLFLKYYEDRKIFPKILGTCGHFYIVEYINLIDNLFMVLHPSWKTTFSLRAELALKLLDYVESVTSDFPDLHICDMKMGHFGVDSLGNIKFLDVDMVFFKPSLIENILAVDKCSQNEDCSFIHCQGSCDTHERRCKPIVLDTNLQRVCTKIFTGQYFGLLSFPPHEIASKLNDLLNKCSKESHNISMQKNISRQLRIMLQTVIL